MKGLFGVAFLVLCTFLAEATKASLVRVPSSMKFADMQLTITDRARKEIQEEVDALTMSQKYFEIKADRARLYFPIIEQTLEENGVPGDFKYLAVQESALISDAVSSSQAVGFWQFKDFTGREVGLRIDRTVDERLNIVSSTIGAAKYFKRNNFRYKNWIYAILAHMTGQSGAMKYVDTDLIGAKKMTIDHHTHWYVRRFLAHMIAFKDVEQTPHSEGMVLDVHMKSSGKTLEQIAKIQKVDILELRKYNKWLKSGSVPTDKPYAVLIPRKGKRTNYKGQHGGDSTPPPIASQRTHNHRTAFPSLLQRPELSGTIFIKINGIPSILAQDGDNLEALYKKTYVRPERLAKYNDLNPKDQLMEGQVYYLKMKRRRSRSYFHTVERNESLWDVSQKFGIRIKSLAWLNRMKFTDEMQPGRVLWLHERRPVHIPVEIKELPIIEPTRATTKMSDATPKSLPERDNNESDTPAVVITGDVPLADQESTVNIEGGNYAIHEVAKGESLYAISKSYNISIDSLVRINKLTDTQLSVGQKIKVPQAQDRPVVATQETTDTQDDSKKVTIHVVQPGDTMYSISRQYGVSVNDLLRMNQKDNFDLAIGEKLILRE